MNANQSSLEPLRRATAQMVAIHAEILALSARADAEWRRELIALRRRLQQEIADIATLMHNMTAEAGDVPHLREAFARMRSAVALHQANWPAVAIDRDHAGYKKSVGDIRAANKEFVALVGALPTR